ncbi:hypothetical protein [Nocardiopsis ganjiahuensis]|uniref:hypothetical protein n=1 Tax=Nocardiopsis ganjiahuensis TaxID=239984 RepID=UPI001267CEC0|nr:hypothetical protein [Nocardiopsis ganjiahuensis]
MTELTDSVNTFYFVPLFIVACGFVSAFWGLAYRLRGDMRPRTAYALVGFMLVGYFIAAIRPWFGWMEIGNYPPRIILGIEEALSFSGATEESIVYGTLFLPVGILASSVLKDYKAWGLIVLGFPLGIEIAQALFGTGRPASMLDYVSASAGIFLGIAISFTTGVAAQRIIGHSNAIQSEHV